MEPALNEPRGSGGGNKAREKKITNSRRSTERAERKQVRASRKQAL
jgi:hypothetical protein